jgi:hypothetical protein
MEAADMKANKAAALLVSELFERKTIDETAESSAEISAKTGRSLASTGRDIQAMLKAGKIEQVWKRGSKGLIPAYRIK